MGINVNIYNVVFFNVGWLACVMGGNAFALIAVICITWAHLQLVSGERHELLWLIGVTMVGVVVDTLLFTLGVLEVPKDDSALKLPPIWMVCLWWLFATTLGYAFQWFKNRLFLAAVLGGISGPLSYYGGAKLSGVVINTDVVSLVVLVACWVLLFPALVAGANRFQALYYSR